MQTRSLEFEDGSGSYASTTRSITVTVQPYYLAEQSEPDENHFIWAYHVRIENQGTETVRLVSRYWRITDSLGKVQEVEGEGVVGEHPVLGPGDSFEYSSGTPLTTPSGFMVGTYFMEVDNGGQFEVDVPCFSLDSPYQSRQVH
ncbi:MAG: Co2+/Mg2+ efflux protein ApaG [Rhodospirillales bacterium]|nr:Co2+/Mg2+ efflux protein ApaG [Rhodospirillales bacterium]